MSIIDHLAAEVEQWRSVRTGSTVPFPGGGNGGDPDPPPEGWADAVATNDMDVIKAWYVANTGYESFYDASLGRTLEFSDLTPYTDGGGSQTTHDGQVIEGKIISSSGLSVQHDNVTVRGCLIELDGALYALRTNTGGKGAGLLVEHCTITRAGSAIPSNLVFFRTDDATMRYCYTTLASSHVRTLNRSGHTYEYNFLDEIIYTSGSHNTVMTVRCDGGGSVVNARVFRNLMVDGNSAAMSMYNRDGGQLDGIDVIENIFDMHYVSSTNYLLNAGQGHENQQNNTVNSQLLRNIFGQTMHATGGSSGWADASQFTADASNLIDGNRMLDGTPVGNQV